MAQMACHSEDESVARTMCRFSTHLGYQLLYDVLVGNTHVIVRVINRLNFQLVACGLIFQLSSIDGQATVQIGFAACFNLLGWQLSAPVVGSVNLRGGISDVDHALGCAAVLIEVDAKRLTIFLLSLSDGHTHGDSDVEVQLARCRVFCVQQVMLPQAFFFIDGTCALKCCGNLSFVVDVDAGLPGKCLWDDVGL